ncbi:MAG: lysophospholipid acyltransferase family protein [Motiliproteus sp.]
MISKLCRLILKLAGWQLDESLPKAHRYVLIAYPHTSNWDFILAMLFKGAMGLKFRWLAKDNLFWWPLGILMRALGGIPVNRRISTGFIEQLTELYQSNPDLVIVVTPEGTRRHRDYWKSGFYHLAKAAELPLVLGYIDFPSKRLGLGPTLEISGDVDADLSNISQFYADKIGRFPEKAGSIRFREPKK